MILGCGLPGDVAVYAAVFGQEHPGFGRFALSSKKN